MGMPMIIGAGVGALSSAAMGKSPFTGALLGGVTGGAFGGAGGFGSGFAGDAGGLLSGLQGVATTPVSMGTGGFASGIGGQVIPNVAAVAPTVTTAAQTASQNFIPQHLVGNSTGMANYVPGGPFNPGDVSNFVENTPFMPNANLTNTIKSAPDFTPVLGRSADYTGGGQGSGGFFGGIKDMIGNPFTDLTGRDKLGLGLQGVGMLNQPQQMIQPQVTPITRGNPDMVSTPLYNVGPNVGRQEGNDIGLPNLFSKMPLSEEEELLRLQREMQTTGFRGR